LAQNDGKNFFDFLVDTDQPFLNIAIAQAMTVLGNIQSFTRKSATALAICFVAFIIFEAAFTSSASADGLSQYKDFISNPPWIKKVTFAQSGNLFPVIIGDKEQRDTSGYVLFDASIQSNSWYLQIVTNAPIGENDPRMGNGFVLGQSFTNYWSVMSSRKKFTVSSFEASEGGPLKHITKMWLNRIQMIQRLGLIYLEPSEIPDVPQSISWVDKLNFKAETSVHGTMKGKIVEFTNDFPEKVELEFSKIPKTTFSVVYGYDAERAFPPFSITAYKTTGNDTKQLWEFLLPNIETGDLEPNFYGFSPGSFMSPDQLASAKKFIENGEKVTVVMNNSKPIEIPRQKPDYGFLEIKNTVSNNEVKAVRTVIWVFMALSVLMLIWLVKKTKNERTK
jgi:hypothetical protein